MHAPLAVKEKLCQLAAFIAMMVILKYLGNDVKLAQSETSAIASATIQDVFIVIRWNGKYIESIKRMCIVRGDT